MSRRWTLKGRRVAAGGAPAPAALVFEDGRIAKVLKGAEAAAASAEVDAGDTLVLPGLVDCHVHVNEPGRTEWEGFATATRAAAAGGVTTIVDMPLNSRPVTTTLEALALKRRAAEGQCAVDVGFWGGVVPGNAGELEAMLDAGISGFKCFLVHSGIDDFPEAKEADLRKALPILARRKAPLLVHAELACAPAPQPAASGARRYDSYLASRPRVWENEAVELMVRLCRETGAPVHIVHLSSSEALAAVEQAKAEGLPFTAETCPHYLFFDAAQVPEGATEYKCAPPIREAENREKLWKALEAGVLDFVVSDHSPCVPELKLREEGDFAKAWGGIAGLQLGLRTVWTEARRRKIPVERLADWMSRRPAEFAGLGRSKGRLAPGYDADVTLFDDGAEAEVTAEEIRHRHKVTPYLGRRLAGRVRTTYLRGERVYSDAAGPAADGQSRQGRLLTREDA